MSTNKLHNEAIAVANLIANYADIIGDDEDAKNDLIAGETSFNEAINAAAARVLTIDSMVEGLKEHKRKTDARLKRLQDQAEMIRAAIGSAVEQVEIVGKIETPVATISQTKVPPKAIIVDEAAIPSDYWIRQDPKLDRKLLLKDLKKEGAKIPGATLSNGGKTISIRSV